MQAACLGGKPAPKTAWHVLCSCIDHCINHRMKMAMQELEQKNNSTAPEK